MQCVQCINHETFVCVLDLMYSWAKFIWALVFATCFIDKTDSSLSFCSCWIK